MSTNAASSKPSPVNSVATDSKPATVSTQPTTLSVVPANQTQAADTAQKEDKDMPKGAFGKGIAKGTVLLATNPYIKAMARNHFGLSLFEEVPAKQANAVKDKEAEIRKDLHTEAPKERGEDLNVVQLCKDSVVWNEVVSLFVEKMVDEVTPGEGAGGPTKAQLQAQVEAKDKMIADMMARLAKLEADSAKSSGKRR